MHKCVSPEKKQGWQNEPPTDWLTSLLSNQRFFLSSAAKKKFERKDWQRYFTPDKKTTRENRLSTLVASSPHLAGRRWFLNYPPTSLFCILKDKRRRRLIFFLCQLISLLRWRFPPSLHIFSISATKICARGCVCSGLAILSFLLRLTRLLMAGSFSLFSESKNRTDLQQHQQQHLWVKTAASESHFHSLPTAAGPQTHKYTYRQRGKHFWAVNAILSLSWSEQAFWRNLIWRNLKKSYQHAICCNGLCYPF